MLRYSKMKRVNLQRGLNYRPILYLRRAAVSIIMSLLIITPTTALTEELIFNTQEFAPFNYTENGKVAGPAADIIRKICTDINAACTMRALPWRRAQHDVKEGTANALFVIGWNQERSTWLDFSPPILNTEYGFFVNTSNSKTFETIADFDGLKVGVFGPSNTSKSLDKLSISDLKNIIIDMTADDISAFKKLEVNRVGAVYSNREVGKAMIDEHKLSRLKYAISHRKLKYYIGFSKQYAPTELVTRFNNRFKELHSQGVIQSILDKYNMAASELE